MAFAFTILGLESEESSVKLSNRNTADIILLLGIFSPDLKGYIRGNHLKKACKSAQVLIDRYGDPEIPPSIIEGPGGAFITYGGRKAGYLTEKIAILHDLACKAGDLGMIQWQQV